MSKCAVFALLVSSAAAGAAAMGVGAMAPRVAMAQGPVDLAISDPQPHFVAAWAPKDEKAAERSAVLARRVSLELEDVMLDVALKALTNQAGLRITYSKAILPEGKRVTISASNVAVVTALTEILFRSGLDVMVDRDGALALVRCTHSVAKAEVVDSGVIVGRVTDTRTGAAIYGAMVLVEGTTRQTTTNSDGHYRLPGLMAGTYTLRVRYIGYAPSTHVVSVAEGSEVTADIGLAKSVQQLDELVTVTPGGLQTEAKALPSPITVITAADIEGQRPITINDVFRRAVPGAVAFSTPMAPGATALTMRGSTETSTGGVGAKILIDGVEATNFLESPVDPASIERIEVIRGPQAATLYGADAAGGVIQIFTKRGDPSRTRPEVSLQAETGVLQTPYTGFKSVVRQSYHAEIRGGTSDATYNLGGSWWRLPDWVNEGGSPSDQSVPSVYGGFHYARGLVTADFSGRYQVTHNWANLNPLLHESGFLPISKPSFSKQEFTNQTVGARLGLNPSSWWSNQVTVGIDRWMVESVQDRPRLTSPDDTLLFADFEAQSKVFLSYNGALRWVTSSPLSATLAFGVDYYRLPVSQTLTTGALNTQNSIQLAPGYAFDVGRSVVTNTGYFGQIELGLHNQLFLTAGLRADDNSASGADAATPVLPRVGLAYTRELRGATLKTRASYGSAMRAPIPSQTLGTASPFFIQLTNTTLRPMRQRGWDGGFDLLVGSQGSVSVTAYDQTAHDVILFVQLASAPVLTYQYQNVGRVTNRGLEVDGSLNLFDTKLQLHGQYAYSFSRIDDLGPVVDNTIEVGDRPLGLPTHTAGGALTLLPWRGTALSAGLTYVGGYSQFDNAAFYRCLGGTGPCQATSRDYVVQFPGFAKLSLSLTQHLRPHLSGYLSVDNLTNNLALEGSPFVPVQGRLTAIGLELRY